MIITVPHPTLRSTSVAVNRVDESLLNLISDLEQTLLKKEKPKGVGLSAPQIDHSLRVFSTFLADPKSDDDRHTILRTFINPEVVTTSKNKTLGENPQSPVLEGCLSIPFLYGPVPRFEWVEYAFQTIENGELKKKYETFYDFSARVMQHEYDHLEGVLFTDYTLKFDLPLYEEVKGKLKPIKPDIVKKF